MMRDIAFLLLRVTLGGLLLSHGAQKLFGWFGGYGIRGTGQWLRSLGLRPGRYWAAAAGMSEFGGGLLTALGLLNPLGPIGAIAAMTMATVKAHWGKPIFVTEGGAELPITNIAVAGAVAMAGPGYYSLDRVLGIRLPRWLTVISALTATAAVAYGISRQPAPSQEAEEQAGAELQGGEPEAAQPPAAEMVEAERITTEMSVGNGLADEGPSARQ